MTQLETPAERVAPLPFDALVRLSLVVVVALVVQTTLLDGLRLHGAHPNALLLIPVAVGLESGPEHGASVGFVVGLVADLLLPTPFGLSALVDTLLGAAAGALRPGGGRPGVWLASPLLGAGGAAGALLRGVLLSLLGVPRVLTAYLPATLVAVTLGGLVLGPLVTWAVRWALPGGTRPSGGVGPGGTAAPRRTRP